MIATALRARDLARGVDSDCTDTLIAHSLRGEGFDASEDGTGRGTPLVPVAYGITRDALDRTGDATSGDAGDRSGLGIIEEQAQTLKAKGPGAVAFALRGREGGALPEIEGQGDTIGTLRAADGGSSRDYVAFAHQGGGVQTRLGYDPDAKTVQTLSANQTPAIAGTVRSHTRPGSNEVGTIVATSAVRRLTPRECERLQGFADDYTLIPWRKGEAPDGPRYKALGNSMAVPVMAWIGRRIEMADTLAQQSAAA